MIFDEFVGVEDGVDGQVDGEFVAAREHVLPDGAVGHAVKFAAVGVARSPGVPRISGLRENLIKGAVFPVIPLVLFFWDFAVTRYDISYILFCDLLVVMVM